MGSDYLQEQHLWQALKEVSDPEFPLSIVDMGLIYDVQVEGGTVKVRMTFTSTACACMQWIEQDIRDRLLKEPDVKEVEIQVVWDPPWTSDRLTKEGREKLAKAGVSV
ncbi:hypothetical protein GCM10011571_12750 [Marinithermofilum abyssi]|jgi:phenylacetate-CoA oxygenase PaaJ subunit|uniref:MIP18 family-like domain-containing protein n=1 Tax=Marinithermofilum abyssi TaxID=1571185 RepID=A0A8J2YAF3_9BACL|nr:metal-sulfur cluster assembly factor [Marinithermofilum abyssi]GGE12783.1 hypothetical protein GCM10011571_12750 [Marinithermofilum abyssi]